MSINVNQCGSYKITKCAKRNGAYDPRLLSITKPNGREIRFIKALTFVSLPSENCEGEREDCITIKGAILDFNGCVNYNGYTVVLSESDAPIEAITAVLTECCPECMPSLETELKTV